MINNSIAILIYGEPGSGRNALTEEKYKDLAIYLQSQDYLVESVLYNDIIADKLANDLRRYEVILVWVNPIEQGNDRKKLDSLLYELSSSGCLVSAHPDVILKIGTKEILYKTREREFGGDIKLYRSYQDFKERFLRTGGPITRILKQSRGNGGKGVFKVDLSELDTKKIRITHAISGEQERTVSVEDFFEEFKSYFFNDGFLVDQPWNPNIINGMVRCYLSGDTVSGFGYQEVNALYPPGKMGSAGKPPGKRYYFSEDCGLFQDLRNIMETKWVRSLRELTSIETEMLPVIWDADFFINEVNTLKTGEKYTLCEINVSSVSPFPPSSIPFMEKEIRKRIDSGKTLLRS